MVRGLCNFHPWSDIMACRSRCTDPRARPSCDDTEHPGLAGGRGVLLIVCFGARARRALKSSRLPTSESLLFRHLLLSFAPYASPRCPFRRDAKRYEIGSSLDLFRLVFLKSGAEGSSPSLRDLRHRSTHRTSRASK
jgi:hypothetical protein